MVPAGVMRPIVSCPESTNQRLPSGPAVMSVGQSRFGLVNCVIVPEVVIRPIAFEVVNQRSPSGPAAMAAG